MKILRPLFLVCGALAGTSLLAQEAAQMATPPPPPPPTPAAPAREPAPVDGLIHVQQLPTTAQLTNDAEAEGMTITRMEQFADRIIVTYRYASGNTRTFAYVTALPVDPDHEIAPPRTMTAPPPPAPRYSVIYSEPAPVYYPRYETRYETRYEPRYTTRYYDPWPTFSLGLGFGHSFGTFGSFGYHHRPHYYGGHHRGHHHRHGDWRR